MLLVILGAGASYDSADPYYVDNAIQDEIPEWQPPLANGLFGRRSHFLKAIDSFKDSRSLVVQLRTALADGTRQLEEELDKVSEKAATDARAATQLMAIRYYLQQTLQACSHHWHRITNGCTYYQVLVERLDEWARARDECIVYVTFNYDTLLEQAIQDSGPKFCIESLEDYISHPRLKLIKLHGSVDWAHVVSLPQPFPSTTEREYVIENALDLRIPSKIVLRPDQNSGTRGQAWVPALAVPIQSKGSFECPPQHIEALQRLLPHVDRVLVIGWRAMEEHFLRMLKADGPKNSRRMLIACKSRKDSGHVFRRLEDVFQVNRSDLGFAELWKRGVSNFENELTFSELVAQPWLIDQLLEQHPAVRQTSLH